MQRQLIGHNSLHNTQVAYAWDVRKAIKMYNVTIKILKLLLHVSAVEGHHQVTYKWGFLFHCTLLKIFFSPWPVIIFLNFFFL
jgi:hypothetical protein